MVNPMASDPYSSITLRSRLSSTGMKKKTVPDHKNGVSNRFRRFVRVLSIPPSQGLLWTANLVTGLGDFPKHLSCWGRDAEVPLQKAMKQVILQPSRTSERHHGRQSSGALTYGWKTICHRSASAWGSWHLFAPLPAQIKLRSYFTHRTTLTK